MYACFHCFDNESLKDYIKKNAEEQYCDYCGRESRTQKISISIEDLVEKIEQSLSLYYIDPEESLYYEDLDAWDQTLDTYDMIYYESGIDCNQDDLRKDIINSFSPRTWFKEDIYFPTLSSSLKMSWRYFEKVIKEKWRYTYFLEQKNQYDPSTFDPLTTFNHIMGIADELGMIYKLEKGTEIFRARKHNKKINVSDAESIGTPLGEYITSPNRLSPIGIPMFYGAFDQETSIEESKGNITRKEIISIGTFKTNVDINIIDFSKELAVPGLFSEENEKIEIIQFINTFGKIISQPINKNDEYLEYIPTQVITEYIRHKGNQDYEIRGIKYRSSKVKNGFNIVLFYLSSDCVNSTTDLNKDCLILKKIEKLSVDKTGVKSFHKMIFSYFKNFTHHLPKIFPLSKRPEN